MKVFFGLKQLKAYRRPVVALGVFDGMHVAHRQILKEVNKKARAIKGTSLVLTFWPHPQKECNIYSLEHRLRLIAELDIDICIVIRFDQMFSKISAEDFIKTILIKKINANYIYVGKNFRFGKDAKGNIKTLYRFSRACDFKLKVFALIKIGNQPVSSSYIRRLIMQGDLKTAEKLLARPVSVLGSVIKGSSLGKMLGFPTANINPHHEVLPPSGVYAVKIVFNNRKLYGICYIGRRPTLKTQKTKNIEVYIFNFKQNIYGKFLEIQFIKKIRDERKFASFKYLTMQIRKDIQSARKTILRHLPTTAYMPSKQ